MIFSLFNTGCLLRRWSGNYLPVSVAVKGRAFWSWGVEVGCILKVPSGLAW